MGKHRGDERTREVLSFVTFVTQHWPVPVGFPIHREGRALRCISEEKGAVIPTGKGWEKLRRAVAVPKLFCSRKIHE